MPGARNKTIGEALKYPSTPYWPWSPTVGRGDAVHRSPERFVGKDVVVTEKLDGGNTMPHAGRVYARSVAAPSGAPWMAMVKKHHAWKLTGQDRYLYGEDLYGIHSIEYDPLPEEETFRAFALRYGDGSFASFGELEEFAAGLEIRVVPVLFRGQFRSVDGIRAFMEEALRQPSSLGGEREGMVMRLARAFPAAEFGSNVVKSVREGHVRSDRHWTRNWRPCRIVGRTRRA